jgi:demethylmenaquinone methyltransferase/2-methoxy-6-polyprenyl-1,4-benzoquinol methylase
MGEEINEMFSKISQKYDLMNHLMSLNIDKSWREEAAREAIVNKEKYNVLDVAAGTCDLSIAISRMVAQNGKRVSIYASDFNRGMLTLGEEKIKKNGIANVETELGNAFEMGHLANSLDVVTSGFALRSFAFSKSKKDGLRKFISESHRVLKPKGKIVLLDMAMPKKKSQAAFFNAYSVIMQALGSLVDAQTYSWLVRTIKAFDKKELVSIMRSSGFKNIRIRDLKSGIAFLVTAEK